MKYVLLIGIKLCPFGSCISDDTHLEILTLVFSYEDKIHNYMWLCFALENKILLQFFKIQIVDYFVDILVPFIWYL